MREEYVLQQARKKEYTSQFYVLMIKGNLSTFKESLISPQSEKAEFAARVNTRSFPFQKRN